MSNHANNSQCPRRADREKAIRYGGSSATRQLPIEGTRLSMSMPLPTDIGGYHFYGGNHQLCGLSEAGHSPGRR